MKPYPLAVAVAGAGIWMLTFGGGVTRAVELTPLAAPPQPPRTKIVTQFGDGTVVEEAIEADVEAEDAGLRIAAPATDGTYNGTVGGKPFTLTVAGNAITFFKVQNFTCPGFTITSSSLSTSCPIAGNDSFTCGSLGCGSAGRMKITGSFSGNTLSGSFDADFQPGGQACCSFRNLSISATRDLTPTAPSNLVATPTSATHVELTWNDNSNNETEFRVEMKGGPAAPSFTDIGSVPANNVGVGVSGLDPSTSYDFRVRARNASGNSGYSNTASATTFGVPTGPCVANSTTMCLNDNRFQVRGTFNTGSQSGQAQVVKLTTDTGYLWFFNSQNVEVVLKVLNACGFGNRYWVFAGGLTDVEVTLTVTDTQTGGVKQYTNPRGTKFAPVQDTNAFATCP